MNAVYTQAVDLTGIATNTPETLSTDGSAEFATQCGTDPSVTRNSCWYKVVNKFTPTATGEYVVLFNQTSTLNSCGLG